MKTKPPLKTIANLGKFTQEGKILSGPYGLIGVQVPNGKTVYFNTNGIFDAGLNKINLGEAKKILNIF